ncbi:hypothetical protein HPULCUR_011029 [Helicostylum pulchrum]|uniref:Uncharacterized protein n=1 Tax=Helicostylum pulchrum TaxID=562976 RepID=A0ABP9YEY1_9FUNG
MKLFNFITIFFLAWIPTNGISTNLKPTASFRSPKNIAFASFGGGSSHHMWVFRILKDMHSRGHNVSFFSRGDQLHFAEGFSVMTIKELGGAFDLLHHPTPVLRHIPFHPHPEVVGTGILESALLNYPVDSSAKYVNYRLYTILHPTSEYTSVWERALSYNTCGRIAKDYAEFYKKLHVVAVDSGNKIQDAVNCYRAYVQISAANAVTRGADLMEESLFASDSDGDLKYRYNIHWIKRNDIDVYALLLLLCLGTIKACHIVYSLVAKYAKLQKL